jgi:hypothetical protein
MIETTNTKQVEAQKSVYYTSIHKLPLEKFIDVYIDGDLQALVIEGEPTDQQLQSAWEDILLQYSDAISSPQQEMYVKKCAQIQKKTLFYNIAVSLISILRTCFVQHFADRLNSMLTTSFKFDITCRETYLHELQRCENRLNGNKLRIDLLQDEIEGLTRNYAGKLTQPTREDFQRTLITLSDHAGRDLDETTITVFAYCERLKRYNKWAEQKEKEASKSYSKTR